MAKESFGVTHPMIETQKEKILTISEMANFFNSLVETSDDYPLHYKTLMKGLDDLHSRGFLKFGPKYNYENRKLNMFTMYVDYGDNITTSHRNFIVLTKDESGNIVGDFYQPTIFNKKSSEITANGIIATDTENSKGISMPTSLVTWNLLQLEANTKNSEVSWFLQNSNLTKLQSLRSEYQKTENNSLLKEINTLEQQQKRWQSVYGPKGKLDVGENEIKKIFPKDQEPYEDFDSLESISLQRVENDDGYSFPKILNFQASMSDEEKERSQNDKNIEFKELLQLLK